MLNAHSLAKVFYQTIPYELLIESTVVIAAPIQSRSTALAHFLEPIVNKLIVIPCNNIIPIDDDTLKYLIQKGMLDESAIHNSAEELFISTLTRISNSKAIYVLDMFGSCSSVHQEVLGSTLVSGMVIRGNRSFKAAQAAVRSASCKTSFMHVDNIHAEFTSLNSSFLRWPIERFLSYIRCLQDQSINVWYIGQIPSEFIQLCQSNRCRISSVTVETLKSTLVASAERFNARKNSALVIGDLNDRAAERMVYESFHTEIPTFFSNLAFSHGCFDQSEDSDSVLHCDNRTELNINMYDLATFSAFLSGLFELLRRRTENKGTLMRPLGAASIHYVTACRSLLGSVQ